MWNIFLNELEDDYLVSPITSSKFEIGFRNEMKSLVTVEEKDGEKSLLFFRLTSVIWDVIKVQKAFVRTYWTSESQLQVFYGEKNTF